MGVISVDNCKSIKQNKVENHHQSSIDLSVAYLGQVQNIARIKDIIRLWRLPFAPSALAPYLPSRKLRVRFSKSSGSRIFKSLFGFYMTLQRSTSELESLIEPYATRTA